MIPTVQQNVFNIPIAAMVQFAELARKIRSRGALDGQPLPVHLRNELDEPLKALRRQDAQFDTMLKRHETSLFDKALTEMIGLYGQIFPEENMRNIDFRLGIDRLLCYLHYRAHHGTIIEPTDALDQLLIASDLHDSLPLRLFELPFPAMYLHCGSRAAQTLTMQRDGLTSHVDGIYCFTGKADAGLQASRTMNLIAILHREDFSSTVIQVTLNLTDGDETLLSFFSNFKERCPPDLWQLYMDVIGYVAKVSLYMGLKEARVVHDDTHTASKERLQRVGGKKQAKLARQSARLYDRIVVGPDQLPAALQAGDAGKHNVGGVRRNPRKFCRPIKHSQIPVKLNG